MIAKKMLEAEVVVERKLPKNLIQSDLKLFSKELSRTISPFYITTINDSFINVNGSVFQSFFRVPIFEKGLAFLKAWLKAFLEKKDLETSHKALLATDYFSGNYFHWLCDVMIKINHLIQTKAIDFSSTILLIPNYVNKGYLYDWLRVFPEIRYRILSEYKLHPVKILLKADELALTGNYRPGTTESFRDSVFERLKISRKTRTKKLWISRSGALQRKIKNEDELGHILRKFNWEVVRMEDYSIGEQVKLVAQAISIGGLHGAGLANTLFLENGCQVLEIRFNNDSHNNCFFSLADSVNADYWYLVTNNLNDVDVHIGDAEISAELLESTLSAMDQSLGNLK